MIDLQFSLDYSEKIVKLLALFGITMEVLPIKISPLKFLGQRLFKSTNDRIDKIQNQVNKIEYDNHMEDLRNIKSRLHNYGRMLTKGEILSENTLKSAMDDLNMYDFYKDKYQYIEVNGRKVKINGEIEIDRQLIIDAMKKNK